jgi:hypothetical protein
MKKVITGKHFVLIAAVAIVWTLVVIGFSTSMGARPLRIYDWGPPAFAGLITLVVMFLKKKRRE